MKKIITGIVFVLIFQVSHAQEPALKRVEPPFWWVGMKNPVLQLIVYGQNISKTTPDLKYKGVELTEVKRTDNPNYLFLKLTLSRDVKPGEMTLSFVAKDSKTLYYKYELKERRPGSADRAGFNASEVMYLLMPDRFANGNPANDNISGMRQQIDRADKNGRHGGDISGIANHLGYLKNLGIRSLWINPLLENNNPEYSYHGYAITDFYNVDKRFGSNDEYAKLVKTCHDNKIKVVMDMVFNHCSVYHWFILDLPMNNWIHQYDDFTRSNFRATTTFDPYASEYDRIRMLTGWFDNHMADLNQRNKLLATYLIQNSIWWIEFADLDGIRVDTQPYSYKEFMSDWGAAILEEYPNFNVVGEAWLQKEPFCAYFQKDAPNVDGYNSNIPAITDFPLRNALNTAFKEQDSWTDGVARFYYVFAQDYLYGNPNNLLIFADNHDLDRIYSSLGNNLASWKMAMAILMTVRGIPCLYYGTEILMEGLEHQGHGFIREDFPGGWQGDPVNLFDENNLPQNQKEAYRYLKTLIRWRNSRPVIHQGKFRHFIPDNNVYVYFRYDEQECTMVAINNHPNEMKAIRAERFNELIDSYTYAVNAITGTPTYLIESFSIPPKSVLILDFKQ